jgi:hypothetical protein
VAEEKEIVLINKSKGKFTINFQGAFPQNKWAVRDGKIHLSEKEYEWVKATYPHILKGDSQRLFKEGEEPAKAAGSASGEDENKAFFSQHHNKVKSAIKEMDEEEAQAKLNYAQLNDVSDGVVKALEDRILELDKAE